MGERSDFAVLPMAIDAMELLGGWGVSAVHERLLHLNRLVWQQVEARGLTGPDADMRAGHIAVVELGDRYRDDLASRLRERGAHVTVRGTKMRITPHVYNDEDDIVRFFDILDAATAWRRRAGDVVAPKHHSLPLPLSRGNDETCAQEPPAADHNYR
jgi:selenocysteine lyase/cysteine desulfurase